MRDNRLQSQRHEGSGVTGVQSVERAFEILRALAIEPSGVTDVGRAVGLPKSTVARLLATLESLEAVERLADGITYRVGSAIGALSAAVGGGQNLDVRMRPLLRRLADEIGEDAGFSVPDGDEVYYIAQADARNAVQVRDWTGTSIPAHLVPSGLVMMAHWPAERLERYLAGELLRSTPHTVTEPAEIRRRLDDIRSRGAIWVHEEFKIGITSVAAPVFWRPGVLAGAIHVHGPAYRFPPEGAAESIAATVRAVAHAASDMLDTTAVVA